MSKALRYLRITFSATCLIASVLAFVSVVGWFFFGDSIRDYLSRQPFDPVTWRGAKDSTEGVRVRMVDDLLRRHRFDGMSQGQVAAIIGAPDQTEYFKDWNMVYWLGPERGFNGIDSEWLVFRLNGNKRVSDYRLVHD